MQNIHMQIMSSRSENRAIGTIAVGAVDIFRVVAEYAPINSGPRSSYPWVTYIVGRENIPQRFMTFEGALSEVKMLTLRQFDLEVQEQTRARINDDLEQMVEEITS